MPEIRRRYDPGFKAGAVRIVRETRKSIAEVACEHNRVPLIAAGTLGNWGRAERIERGEAEGLTSDDRAELVRLRRRCAELETQRDVLKRTQTHHHPVNQSTHWSARRRAARRPRTWNPDTPAFVPSRHPTRRGGPRQRPPPRRQLAPAGGRR